MNDQQFESMLLGHAIECPELYAPARALVDAGKHFSTEANAILWGCVWTLADAGSPCTYRTVAELAHKRGFVGASVALQGCEVQARATPTGAAAEASELVARSEARRCIAALDEARAAVTEGKQSLEDICRDTIGALCLFRSDQSKSSYSGGEASKAVERSLEERALGKKKGITTGITELDEALSEGLVGGRLVTIAARTGVGKTSLALGFASEAIMAGAHVVYISFEMPVDELLFRMCSRDYRIPPRELFRGKVGRENAVKLAEFHAFLARGKSHWIAESTLDIEQLAGKVATLHASMAVDLLIVDYAQQVDAAKNHRGNRVEEIEEVARSLKALALRLDCCVIAVAQLNRSNEDDGQMKPPNISHIHGSSSIERYSDQVLLLHRPSRQSERADLIVGKNRHGRGPTIPLTFEPQFTRFSAGVADRFTPSEKAFDRLVGD